MLPLVRGEILSVVTHFEPGARLEEDFEGAGMTGHLAYPFVPLDGGTRLTQRETGRTHGFARVLEPIMKPMLARQLRKRLESIKVLLESGPVVREQE
jgi:hypothetical protein